MKTSLILLALACAGKLCAQTVISQGGTYSGNYYGVTDQKIPAVYVLTTEPVIFSNDAFEGNVCILAVSGADITVQESVFSGIERRDGKKPILIIAPNAAQVALRNCSIYSDPEGMIVSNKLP
jgi:hypothetical protein